MFYDEGFNYGFQFNLCVLGAMPTVVVGMFSHHICDGIAQERPTEIVK
jgi:hypothetical protein